MYEKECYDGHAKFPEIPGITFTKILRCRCLHENVKPSCASWLPGTGKPRSTNGLKCSIQSNRYAAPALRTASAMDPGRGRKPQYGSKAKVAVKAILNFPTGKRLQPFLPDLAPRLEHGGELTLDASVRAPLLAMSVASINRFLAAERQRLEIKGRSGTKPGTLLKRPIPVRAWAEWDDATQPGFLEIDLVSHDGGAAITRTTAVMGSRKTGRSCGTSWATGAMI